MTDKQGEERESMCVCIAIARGYDIDSKYNIPFILFVLVLRIWNINSSFNYYHKNMVKYIISS